MKKTLATAAILAVSAASAFAADLSPTYSKAPLATQSSFTWTGVYVGINAGALLHAPTIDDKACDLSCSSQTLSSTSATVGGTLGYNHQFGAGVIGLEGDINWANARMDIVDPAWGPAGSAHHTKMDWFSTIRLRAGLAVDRALIYATGGVAFVDRNVNGQYSITGACNGACFSIKDTAVGFVGGVGAEYAFAGPWSAKMEYLYIATPAKQVHSLAPGAPFSEIFGVTTSTQVLRVGLNYKIF